jgi:NTP pyrophosphatase (non-canonical NTP hydrolase)
MSRSLLERVTETAFDLNVVLCGSFRRDPIALAEVHRLLAARFTLLSPASVSFVDPDAEFLRLDHEIDEGVAVIEDRHLAAIRDADFVWLLAPAGYVGRSAAMEIGHARALGVPVFTDTPIQDVLLAEYVTVVDSPLQVPLALTASPGSGLAGLQQYYRRVSDRRGWSGESPQDTLLLLTEELGELARAVRKRAGMRRDGAYPEANVGEELADVQLYLVHLANALEVDIASAVTAKEAVNAARFATVAPATAMAVEPFEVLKILDKITGFWVNRPLGMRFNSFWEEAVTRFNALVHNSELDKLQEAARQEAILRGDIKPEASDAEWLKAKVEAAKAEADVYSSLADNALLMYEVLQRAARQAEESGVDND